MSDYGRYNQGSFGGNWNANPTGRGEGGSSDAALEQRFNQPQQNQYVDPNDALLQGAMADPMLKQQLAEDLRRRFSGQQEQQPQSDPLQGLRDDLVELKRKADEIRAMPDGEGKDYGKLYQLDHEYLTKQNELTRQEYDRRFEQQNMQQRGQQAVSVYHQFLLSAMGRLPMSDEQKRQLGEEFTYQIRSMYDQGTLSDPDALQRLLPQAFAAFAYDKNLPRPGQPSSQPQGQAPRVGEQYNGMTPPAPPPPDPNDPLAKLADMNDMERATMKAFYETKGDYATAEKITKRDGSPIEKWGQP